MILEERQCQLLKSVEQRLPLCAVLSRQDILLVVNGEKNAFSIARGAKVSRLEESWKECLPPCLQSYLKKYSEGYSQKAIVCMEEEPLQAHGYPIVDNGGKCIASLLFLGEPFEKELTILAETAFAMATQAEGSHLEYKPSYQEGMLLVEETGNIISANEAAYHMSALMGLDRRVLDTSIYGAIHREAWQEAFISRSVQSRMRVWGDMVFLESIIPVFKVGRPPKAFVIWEDRTKLKQAERALLVQHSILKEMHHRIKNDLQMVAGMLRMQSRRTTERIVKEALLEGVHRIESFALAHEALSYYKGEEVEVGVLVQKLQQLLKQSYAPKELCLDMQFEGENFWLSAKEAGYISMVLNELMSNAMVHGILPAWQKRNKQLLSLVVRASKEGDEKSIFVIDNGVGIPLGWQETSARRLGLQIVKNIVEEQLEGSFSVEKNNEGGTQALCIWR